MLAIREIARDTLDREAAMDSEDEVNWEAEMKSLGDDKSQEHLLTAPIWRIPTYCLTIQANDRKDAKNIAQEMAKLRSRKG